jgi:hypothetical protein
MKMLSRITLRGWIAVMLAAAAALAITLFALAQHGALASKSLSARDASQRVVTTAVPGGVVPAAAIPQLKKVAMLLAGGNGDRHPASIQAAITGRVNAISFVTPGNTVIGAKGTVYVIVIRGKFVGYLTKTPSAAKPTGDTIAADIDPTTFRILDWSLTNLPLNRTISTLGRVTRV